MTDITSDDPWGAAAYEANPDAPTAIQVELVEGCNMRCPFCGLNGIRNVNEAVFKHMTLETAGRLATEIARLGWRPRIEFAMHGEPTLHPDAPGMVRVFREHLPAAHLMMTSNGGGLLRKSDVTGNIMALFGAGLNVLAIDMYEHGDVGVRVQAGYLPSDDGAAPPPLWYPDIPEANPHRRRKPTDRDLVFIRDISLPDVKTGTHAKLNNHSGSGAPRNMDANGKRCAKPFRELSVRWDGNVAICCNDWRGDYKIANVNELPLDELWRHPHFRAARRALYHGLRDFGPCHGCDALSYRTGLLPDRMGKHDLPEPEQSDRLLMATACSGPPFTAPRYRPWELNRAGKPLPVVKQIERQAKAAEAAE